MLRLILEWLARLAGLRVSKPVIAQAELPALVHVMSGEYAAGALRVRAHGAGESTPRQGVEVRFSVLDGAAELDGGRSEVRVRTDAEGVARAGVRMREVG